MITVEVEALAADLPTFLRKAASGETILIESENRPLAELHPPAGVQPESVNLISEDLEPGIHDTVLLSEAALAVDWNRPEEDEAWAYLQPAQ